MVYPLPDFGRVMAFDVSVPVLVVDDQATMVRIMRKLLGQIGFNNVDDASDGATGMSKMREKQYGLVISDWNLDSMTGFDFLQAVRSDPALGQTPFIIVTAESKMENVVAAKKAGVSNYLLKPFDAQTLKMKIEAVFTPETKAAVARVASRQDKDFGKSSSALATA